MLAERSSTDQEAAANIPPLKVLETGPAVPSGEVEIDIGEAESTRRTQRRKWDRDEMKLVAGETARLCRKQGWRRMPSEGDRTGRQMLRDFLCTAQALLPRERRRLDAPLQAFNVIFWKFVEDALASPPAEPPAPPAAIAAPPAADQAPPPEAKPTPPAGHIILPNANPFDNVPLEVLLGAIASRLAKTLSAHGNKIEEFDTFANLVSEQMTVLGKKDEETSRRVAALENDIKNLSGSTRSNLPRVAIVGCVRSEFNKIVDAARELGIPAEMRFYDADTTPTRLHAEYSIQLRFSNHAWRQQIKDSIPAGHQVFLDGLSSAAVEQLKKWFPK